MMYSTLVIMDTFDFFSSLITMFYKMDSVYFLFIILLHFLSSFTSLGPSFRVFFYIFSGFLAIFILLPSNNSNKTNNHFLNLIITLKCAKYRKPIYIIKNLNNTPRDSFMFREKLKVILVSLNV